MSMSSYEFQCEDCKHVFTVSMTIKERETQKVACPKCKGTNVKWFPTPFFAVTSKKS